MRKKARKRRPSPQNKRVRAELLVGKVALFLWLAQEVIRARDDAELEGDGRVLAQAMAAELEGIKMARPMTHDLLRNILGELGAAVERVTAVRLENRVLIVEVPDQNWDREIARNRSWGAFRRSTFDWTPPTAGGALTVRLPRPSTSTRSTSARV